jgi:programmed cell death protein 5
MDQTTLPPTMSNTAIDPQDLPAGFTLQDPHSNSNNNSNTNAGAAVQQQQRQSILEQVMEPDALARLRRIQLVKPKKAQMLENAIIQLATSNTLTAPISDGKFVEMLERQLAQDHHKMSASASDNNSNDTTSSKKSGMISIQRKKYAMDSDDDDDDNDDDLL